MVQWPEGSAAKFDHARRDGRSGRSTPRPTASDCHVAKYAVSPPANLSARKTGQGYTGLGTTCTSCHEDVHRAALGQNCTQCHDAASWTVTPGFDHDTTAYPLTGQARPRSSATTATSTPRLAPKSDGRGHLVPVYKPVSFATCTGLPRGSALGRARSPVRGLPHARRGSRSSTRTGSTTTGPSIRCAGRHAAVTLRRLPQGLRDAGAQEAGLRHLRQLPPGRAQRHRHAGGQAGRLRLLPHGGRVHALDLHRGEPRDDQVPARGEARGGASARACHTRSARRPRWRPTAASKVVMRPAFARCTDCHADDHGGQLRATRRPRASARACHRRDRLDAEHLRQRGARPADAARARRPAPGGRLRGVPRDRPEGLPPMSTTAALGKANFLFKVTEIDCAACHADPHQGRFADRRGPGEGRRGAWPATGPASFRPSSTDGARSHAAVRLSARGWRTGRRACSACHKELGRPAVAARSSLRAGRHPVRPTSSSRRSRSASTATPRRTAPSSTRGTPRVAARPVTRWSASRRRTSSTTTPTRPSRSRAPTRSVPCAQCHVRDPKSPDPTALIYRPALGEVRDVPRQGVPMKRLILVGLSPAARRARSRRSSAPPRRTAT